MICITLYCNTYCNVASINCFVMCVIWNLMNNPERKVSFDFCFLWRLLMMFATTPGGKSRHSSFSLMICVTNPTSEKSVQETQSHDKLSFRFPSWNHKLLTKGLQKRHAQHTRYLPKLFPHAEVTDFCSILLEYMFLCNLSPTTLYPGAQGLASFIDTWTKAPICFTSSSQSSEWLSTSSTVSTVISGSSSSITLPSSRTTCLWILFSMFFTVLVSTLFFKKGVYCLNDDVICFSWGWITKW